MSTGGTDRTDGSGGGASEGSGSAGAGTDPTGSDGPIRGAAAAVPLKVRDVGTTFLVGVAVALLTGLIPHQPEVYVIGGRYYGYPLYWRVVMTEAGTQSVATANLLIDVVVFWIGGLLALPPARWARDRVRERGE